MGTGKERDAHGSAKWAKQPAIEGVISNIRMPGFTIAAVWARSCLGLPVGGEASGRALRSPVQQHRREVENGAGSKQKAEARPSSRSKGSSRAGPDWPPGSDWPSGND